MKQILNDLNKYCVENAGDIFPTIDRYVINVYMRNPSTFYEDIDEIIKYFGQYYINYTYCDRKEGKFHFQIKKSFLRHNTVKYIIND